MYMGTDMGINMTIEINLDTDMSTDMDMDVDMDMDMDMYMDSDTDIVYENEKFNLYKFSVFTENFEALSFESVNFFIFPYR
jgi:hypothetical protein